MGEAKIKRERQEAEAARRRAERLARNAPKKRRGLVPVRVRLGDELYLVQAGGKVYRATARGLRREKDPAVLEKVTAEVANLVNRRSPAPKAHAGAGADA